MEYLCPTKCEHNSGVPASPYFFRTKCRPGRSIEARGRILSVIDSRAAATGER